MECTPVTDDQLNQLLWTSRQAEAAAGWPAGTVESLVMELRSRRKAAESESNAKATKAERDAAFETAWPAAVTVAQRGGEFTSEHIWREIKARGISIEKTKAVMLRIVNKLVRDGYARSVNGKRTKGGPESRRGTVNVYRGIS